MPNIKPPCYDLGMLRAIFLDWDGTLSKGRFWQQYQAERPTLYADIQTALFQDKARIHDWMRGKYLSEDIVTMLAPQLEISTTELLNDLATSCRALTLLHPHLPSQISTLRQQGLLVAIATDNMDTFHRWTVPSLQLDSLVDGVLSSAQLGLLKNDVSANGSLPFFTGFLAANQLVPAECLIIDDSAKLEPLAIANNFQYYRVTADTPAFDALTQIMKHPDFQSPGV